MLKQLWHRLHLVLYSWRAIGLRQMIRNALRWQADPELRAVDSGFDARFGTDTNAGLTPAEAGIPSGRREAACMYMPSMDRDLHAMLAALEWPRAQLRRTTFVDLGSGKARVVLLAAMGELHRVVGVELSPVLHAVAERNLALVRAAGVLQSPVSLVQCDAGAFDVPAGPVVTYLYHPFNDVVASAVMQRLVASLAQDPRPAAILYGHPRLQAPINPAVFANGGVFAPEAEGLRRTRRNHIGWTIWTNRAWLAEQRAITRPARAASAGAAPG